jgi:NTP pyrophosphatase (non-canonical NTP hydrolase)
MPSKPHGLNDWMKLVSEIYGERNHRMHLGPKELLLHVIEEAGEVARDFRKEDHDRLKEDLPDVFIWLCAFASEYFITDLEEVVWYKFPGICPYCHQRESCSCLGRGLEYRRDHDILKAARRNLEYQRYSLDRWQEHFERIYGGMNRALPYFMIGFHLLEELGEIAKELRRNDFLLCKEEIADAFAWIFAITLKANKRGMGKLSEVVLDLC